MRCIEKKMPLNSLYYVLYGLLTLSVSFSAGGCFVALFWMIRYTISVSSMYISGVEDTLR